jgi:hypothetical protein
VPDLATIADPARTTTTAALPSGLEKAVEAPLDPDARAERMDRVALLYAEISAATREFLLALAESDRHGDWADEGFGSCAEWLAWRVGITLNAANEKVRSARALEDLPLISDAMSRGELSFSKVRALTRVANAENEADLLALAQAGSAANLERVVRSWRWGSRGEELAEEVVRHRNRHLSVFPDNEGMYVVKGRVPPEVGAMLMRAIEAASDALFARPVPSPGASGPTSEDVPPPEPPQLRADALGLLAERALAAGFGGEGPVSGSRAERYQVVLHVDPETLREDGELAQSELEDGTRVTAETARRIACDSGTVRVAHHVRHWADGGETSLRNLVLLCRRHHRTVHEEGHRVFVDRRGQVAFFTPKGRPMFEVPPADVPPAGVDGSRRASVFASPGSLAATASPARPTAWSQAPRWKRDSDIPWEVEGVAVEAAAGIGG